MTFQTLLARLPIPKELCRVLATTPIKWTVLSRAAIAMALLLPSEMRIANICDWCTSADDAAPSTLNSALCLSLSGLEVLCACSYAVGGLTRWFAKPVMVILVLKALSGLLSSWPGLGIPLILGRGDWAYGAADLGALILVMDLLELGSGAWSVDYLLSVRYPTKNDCPTLKEIP